MIDYEIISTGSTGNSVRIENILIDCGVNFEKLEHFIYDINYLLLTHVHGDHIHQATLNKIKKLYPIIKIIGNSDVNKTFGVDIVLNPGESIDTNSLHLDAACNVTAFHAPHDCPCNGYVLHIKGSNIVYATDLYTTKYIPKEKYDYVFLEANYDSDLIETIRLHKDLQKQYNYNVVDAAYRHLSKQDSKAFYYGNRKNKDSVYIPLHQSQKFY